MRTVIQNQIRSNEIFMIVSKADILQAAAELNDRAFRAYIVLISNTDGYITEHPAKMIEDALKVKHPFGTKAIQELIKAGYIIRKDQEQIVFSYSNTLGRPEPYETPRIKGRNNWNKDSNVPKENVQRSETEHSNVPKENNSCSETEQSMFRNGTTNNTTNTTITSNNTSNNTEDYYSDADFLGLEEC